MFKILLLSFIAFYSSASILLAQQDFMFNFYGNSKAVPDQNPNGLVDSHSISVPSDPSIIDINVSLTISGIGFGGFNGDLYVTLQHEDGFSVLLNRPGVRPGDSSGYSDNGINVTFDDSINRDIHSYRLVLSGNENTPIVGPLSGVWSSDGRNVDPNLVQPSSARTAMLDSFNGESLNGTWTLFISDLSSGGTVQLDGWALDVTAVPEPTPMALTAILAFGALVFRWALLKRRDV